MPERVFHACAPQWIVVGCIRERVPKITIIVKEPSTLHFRDLDLVCFLVSDGPVFCSVSLRWVRSMMPLKDCQQ